jgi:hypothetical protein
MEIDLQGYCINSIQVNSKEGCIAIRIESVHEPNPSNAKDDWENIKKTVLFKGVVAYQISDDLKGRLWSISEIPSQRLSELASEFWDQKARPEWFEISKANGDEKAASEKNVFQIASEYGFDAFIVSSTCEIGEDQHEHSE